MFAQYGVDALEVQPETDATVKSWNRSFWMRMRTTLNSKPNYGFDLFNDISISEWRDTIYTKYGPPIQHMVTIHIRKIPVNYYILTFFFLVI